ncbi:MAG: 4a-hydroxytetrahydrobiopterin dehydratase [Proteobacteria bacterium]|jgi:4a-hydroxytetrahydrobiopterin dehydratase|nr:4a-hydroxytetrahydrobiopterin dehydratase [Pseudomonadota bacterium]MCG6934987.1 4a-hydroxytetrahydrobiopterin dehydratase [Pseudomonadota bacterium]
MSALAERECTALPKGTPPLDADQAAHLLNEVPGWKITPTGTALQREFCFKDYYQTMAFVNAIAWIAHRTDHHPDLSVGYNRCTVTYSTHSIGGLSDNDFVCAARIDQLDPR